MQSKADFVRFLWRLLVVAVIVYVVGGIVLVFTDEVDPFGGISGFNSFLADAQFIAFRVGAGCLALMAGLWLSTRSWDDA